MIFFKGKAIISGYLLPGSPTFYRERLILLLRKVPGRLSPYGRNIE